MMNHPIIHHSDPDIDFMLKANAETDGEELM